MGVDGGVSGSSCQTFVLPVFDVFAVSSNVALSKTEINDVYLKGLWDWLESYLVRSFSNSH